MDACVLETSSDGAVARLHAPSIVSGQELWSVPAAALTTITTYPSPLEEDGTTYILDPNDRLIAVDSRTGATRWSQALPADDDLTLAMGDRQLLAGSAGRLSASDRQTVLRLWQRQIGIRGRRIFAVQAGDQICVSVGGKPPPYRD